MARKSNKGQEPKIVYTNDEPPPKVECDRCVSSGVLPYWQIIEGQVQERSGRCSCVNGLRFPHLRHIDQIPGIPKGLNAAQMSAILNAMIAHPGLPPAEAIGFIPRSRADLEAAFRGISGKYKLELSKRYCPDDALKRSWLQIRDAILAEIQPEPEFPDAADLPF